MSQEHIVYKLQGKSLLAAKELEIFAENYWAAQPPVIYPINMVDLNQHVRAVNASMLRELQDKNPALAAAAGLDKPVIKVLSGPDASPRAYAAWPEIFTTALGAKSEYFMFAPVGYDAASFLPDDAAPLNAKQEARAGDMLFAGGWLGNAPLLDRPDQGVTLPSDFDPATSLTCKRGGLSSDEETIRVFRAAGESLNAVEDLQSRKAFYDVAVDALFAHIKTMAPRSALNKDDTIVMVHANMSLSAEAGQPPKIKISLRALDTGEAVPVKDTRGYLVGSAESYGEVEIVPNPDSDAGKKFRELLGNPALARPDVGDYPALRCSPAKDLNAQFENAAGDGGEIPILRNFGDDHYLVYHVPRGNNPDRPGPPGALPVSPEAFHWLDADATDEMRGITPPPMPPGIAAELATLKPQGNTAKPQPPQP